MPHKCLDCKNLIESGTIDLQKGCPICGGKKFQYIRPRPQPGEQPERKQTVAEYVSSAALREPQVEAREAPVPRVPGRKPRESAGAASRDSAGVAPQPKDSTYVDTATLKPAETRTMFKPRPAPRRDEGEKGERIESIRIIENGTYDINLPLLLSRKELVTSREEGNYTVDLNSALKPAKKKPKGKK